MTNRRNFVTEAAFKCRQCKRPQPRKTINEDFKDDIYYMKKLAEEDMQHSQRMGLTEENFWDTMTDLEKQIGVKKPPPCAQIKADYFSCLMDNDYQTTKCSELMQEFTECISKATTELLQDIHKESTSTTP